MKVKIKGLVFVGFAAAVFASNAMAVIRPNENDKKVVASKYYVDETFQDQDDRVTETPAGNSSVWDSTDRYPSMAVLKDVRDTLDDIDVVEGSTGYVDVTENPTGTFTVDLVSSKVATANSDVTGTLDSTAQAKLATAGAVNSLIDTSLSDATGAEDDTTMPTSAAVVSYAEKKANKLAYDATANNGAGAETITSAATAQNDNTSNTTYPTTKNVYEFVTGAISASDIIVAGDDTYIKSVWNADNRTYTVGPKETVVTTKAGVIGVNDGHLITSGGVRAYAEATDNKLLYDTSLNKETITTNKTNNVLFPTAQNVYEFVKNSINGSRHQRKLDVTEGKGIYVGKYDDTLGDSEWKQLTPILTGAQSAKPYVSIKEDNGEYKINLLDAKVGYHGYAQAESSPNAGDGWSSDIYNGSDKLATGTAVYEYVDRNAQPVAPGTGTVVQIGYNGTWHPLSGDSYITVSDNGNNAASVTLGHMTAHGVTGGTAPDTYTSDFVASNDQNASTKRDLLARAGDVYDFVMDKVGGLAIPPMPGECTTAASSGGYCALVYGDTGTGTAQNPVYGLMWTVMAPEPATGGGSNP